MTSQTHAPNTSPDVLAKFQAELEPGEEIQWTGAPSGSAIGTATDQRWKVGAGALLAIMTIRVQHARTSGFTEFEDVPFIALGILLLALFLISAPWRIAKSRSRNLVYAITNRRALLVGKRWSHTVVGKREFYVRSILGDELESRELKQSRGRGSIMMATGDLEAHHDEEGFLDLPNVLEVDSLLAAVPADRFPEGNEKLIAPPQESTTQALNSLPELVERLHQELAAEEELLWQSEPYRCSGGRREIYAITNRRALIISRFKDAVSTEKIRPKDLYSIRRRERGAGRGDLLLSPPGYTTPITLHNLRNPKAVERALRYFRKPRRRKPTTSPPESPKRNLSPEPESIPSEDENILWTGSPLPRYHAREQYKALFGNLLWILIPGLCAYFYWQSAFPVAILLALVGAYGVLRLFLFIVNQPRPKTVYTLTRKQALISKEGSSGPIKYQPLEEIADVYRVTREDGSGDVVFCCNVGDTPVSFRFFEGIADHQQVERLVYEAIHGQRPPATHSPAEASKRSEAILGPLPTPAAERIRRELWEEERLLWAGLPHKVETQRQAEIYAITDLRAMFIRPGKETTLFSTDPRSLEQLVRNDQPNGTTDILFWEDFVDVLEPGFYGLKDADEPWRLLKGLASRTAQ